MNGGQILDEARRVSGVPIGDFSEINDAYDFLLKRAGMERSRVRDTTSLIFKDGVSTYALPMDRIRRLEGVEVKDNDNSREWYSVRIVSDDLFSVEQAKWRQNDGTDTEDRPRFGRLSLGSPGEEFEVTPTPDGTYTTRLIYVGMPPRLGRNVVPVFPELYHMTVAKMGGVYAIRTALLSESSEVRRAVLKETMAELQREVAMDMPHLGLDVSMMARGVEKPRRRLMRS